MYKLDYLPLALQDMVDIAKYISQDLGNPIAAEKLVDEMIEAADKLVDFPYLYAIHQLVKPLNYEYRKLIINNYIMFYRVDEKNKQVTISRVIYARREYENIL